MGLKDSLDAQAPAGRRTSALELRRQRHAQVPITAVGVFRLLWTALQDGQPLEATGFTADAVVHTAGVPACSPVIRHDVRGRQGNRAQGLDGPLRGRCSSRTHGINARPAPRTFNSRRADNRK